MTDLKHLSLEELTGVVNVYPWFGIARKELCRRMSGLGEWGAGQFAEAALYVSDRRVLSDLLRGMSKQECADADIAAIVDSCVGASAVVPEDNVPGAEIQSAPAEKRKVVVVGGDFFSQDDYDKVRSEGDVFTLRTSVPSQGESSSAKKRAEGLEMEFCTETLAQIYAEQGYYDQAKAIYSKLILAIPEKSVYFATLIDRLGH